MLYAGVVELADTIDLGSIAFACRFKSCHPHQNERLWRSFTSIFALRKYIVVCRDALQSILVFYRLYDAEPKSRRLFQAPRFGNVVITQIIAWGGSRCPCHQNEIGDFVYEYFRFAKIRRGLLVNATDLLKAASQNVAVALVN